MEAQWRQLSDDLGPEKIIFVREPWVGLEAMLVVDNVAAGPAIGGIRMAPDISVQEVFRLARAMTLKNAAAGLPHGGGKSGIVGDPAMPHDQKERLVRAFGRAIADIEDYIPGPDMGIDEACMGYLQDEIGRCVGLPRVLGGIPLDTIGATGFGVAIAAEVAEEVAGLVVRGARVVIQGFGAVGRHAARFLAERGAVIVAASDSRGAVENGDGLDLEKLSIFKEEGNTVRDFPGGVPIDPDGLVGYDCDVWVPAARPDVFTGQNAPDVRARLILQGANIPATPEAERILHQRGILSIPDFIANAGGVICGSVEYHGGSEAQAFAAIEEKVRANTREMLELAMSQNLEPRIAAERIARARIEEMTAYRRAF